MSHCMLDIETLGTTPGSVVLSIGAVAFDLHNPQPIAALPSFFVALDVDDSMRLGLRIEPATLKWWLQQRSATLAAQMENPSPVVDALVVFTEWLHKNDCEYIWGNSAAFDCGLLSAVYRAANVAQPWSHRNERCYRTIAALTGTIFKEKDKNAAHNPVYDAQYQVEHLWKSVAEFRIVGYDQLVGAGIDY